MTASPFRQCVGTGGQLADGFRRDVALALRRTSDAIVSPSSTKHRDRPRD